MTLSSFSPVLDPKLAERLVEAVRYLEVPADALFIQVLEDMLRQRNSRRRALQLAMDQVLAEGHGALARILMCADDLKRRPDDDYLNRP